MVYVLNALFKKGLYLRIILLLAIVSLILLFSGGLMAMEKSNGNDEEIANTEENLNKIIQHFAAMKKENKIPGISKNDTGGELYVFRIGGDKNRIKKLNAMMVDDSKNCNDLYKMELKFNGNKYCYLFCINNSSVELVSAYKHEKEKWIKLRKRNE